LRYLAQIVVHEDTDNANKRNHNIINDSVLRHNCATGAIPSKVV